MSADPISDLTLASQPGVTRAEYLSAAFETLGRVFPSESAGWNCLDTETGHVEASGTPDVFGVDSEALRLLVRLPDHPMVISYLRQPGGFEPRRLSDLVSVADLRRTRTYAELLRPFRADHQFTILTQRTGARAGSCWTFNRQSMDFSDADIALAARVQPLLILIERTWDVFAAPRTAAGDLTGRETDVLRLVATGLTGKGVGARLGISAATVSKHLEHIYRKLGCGDRITALRTARARGILP